MRERPEDRHSVKWADKIDPRVFEWLEVIVIRLDDVYASRMVIGGGRG
jgi:hypothetical protein